MPGLYNAFRSAVPKGTFRKYGGRMGGWVGGMYGHGKLGKYAGRAAGGALARVVGFGSYRAYGPRRTFIRPRQNYGRGRIQGSGAYGNSIMPSRGRPRISKSGTDPTQIWIDECEYLSDIYSGGASGSGSPPTGPTVFTTNQYCINPGLSSSQGGLFQWLSSIALCFQQYAFTKLVVQYKPTSGNATGANTSLGQIMMACDYENQTAGDITQAPFGSKAEMLNSEFGVSGDPSKTIYLPVECKKSERANNLYDIRYFDQRALPAQIQSQTDINTHDYGMIQIATVGQQTAYQQLGELWVHYRVRLTKKKYIPPGGNAQNAHYELNPANTANGVSYINQEQWFGTVNQASGGGYLPVAPAAGWAGYQFPFTWQQGVIPAFVPTKNNKMPVALYSNGQANPTGYSHNVIQIPHFITEGIFRFEICQYWGGNDTYGTLAAAAYTLYNCEFVQYDVAMSVNNGLNASNNYGMVLTDFYPAPLSAAQFYFYVKITGPASWIDISTFQWANSGVYTNPIVASSVIISEVVEENQNN